MKDIFSNQTTCRSIDYCFNLAAAIIISALLTACGDEQSVEQAGIAASPPATESAGEVESLAHGADAMNEADYRRHIEILAFDEFGGRAPASPGETLTVDYLTRTFADLGLDPANGDSYTQDVPLAWVQVTNNPDLVFSGGEGEDLNLAYIADQVIWTRQQVPAAGIQDSGRA